MSTPDPTPANNHRSQRIGLLLALGSAALFSLKAIVVKLGFASGVGVEVLMLWRMCLALPVYLAVGVYSLGQRAAGSPTSLRTYAAAAGLGVLSYYVCTWLDFSGMRYISAQLERMVLFTYPILTALLAWAIFRERFTRQHALALVLSYAGVVLVFGSEMKSIGADAGRGIALVFGAALLFAFYAIYAKAVIRDLGSILFTCIAMTAATVAIITHNTLAVTATGQPGSAAFSATAITAGAVLAVLCTLLPSFMFSEALARIGATRASAAGNIGPVVTTILAVWILGEPFGLAQATGLALILVGVGLVGRQKDKPKRNDR